MASNSSLANDSEALARKCVEICEDRKAENLRMFDVRGDSVLADFYIICTGTSKPHIRAISENLKQGLAEEGIRPRGKEGDPSSQWIVMDYGVVLVHILDQERRDFYRIEELWGDSHLAYHTPPEANADRLN
jgi:ribosome-associated protein